MLEEFLGRLPAEAVAEFERLGARRRFPAGSTLFIEGDHAHEVFVLLAAAVKVSVGSVEGREVVLDVFEPGVFLGELSVLDGGPRSTVTALSPVEVLTIAAGAFNEFLDRYPQALRLLLVEVIARLRTTSPAGVRCRGRARAGLRPPRGVGGSLRGARGPRWHDGSHPVTSHPGGPGGVDRLVP